MVEAEPVTIEVQEPAGPVAPAVQDQSAEAETPTQTEPDPGAEAMIEPTSIEVMPPPETTSPEPEIPTTPPADTSPQATPPQNDTASQVAALPIDDDPEPAPADSVTHSEPPPDDSLPVEDTSIAEETNLVQTASAIPPPDVSYFDKLLEQVKP